MSSALHGVVTQRVGSERAISVLTLALLLALWSALAASGRFNPIFIPSPAAVWQAFVDVLLQGYQGAQLHEHILASLKRVLAGYGLALAIGIPLGLVMGLSRHVRAIFDPLIEFYRPLPPLGLYTLLVMWLGIGDSSKIALLALAGLPALTLSSMQAVRGIDPQLIKAARSLGAGRLRLFFTVILPASLPGICTGMRIGLGFTYTVLVAAEIVAASAGIGWMIWDASKFLLTPVVVMGLVVMGATGWLLDSAVRLLERRLTAWRFIR
ncbi:ABC transporter permease [Niveibacterium sp. SC-1]|uniref:ABC transporter permease n=1 Tax=Niveibacterium sp. SC-1 TaxID=3135646 RepID=UPI00311F5CC0